MNVIAALGVVSMVGGLLMPYVANAESVLERGKRDEIAVVRDKDPAMAAAFKKARAGLDEFLVVARNPHPNLRTVAVKVGVTERGNTEYFWIVPFREESTGFSGKINNHPRWTKSVKLGQEVRFTKEQIVDWMYFDTVNNRMVGNYTSCALLTKEPPAEAEKYKKQMGLECDV